MTGVLGQGTRLIGRTTAAAPERIDRARGVRLWTEGGREVLDGVSGAMTTNFGYTNPDIVDALTRTAHRIPYLHESRGRLRELELLADELVALAPERLGSAYFTVSGADAVEAAIRMAVLYQQGRGRRERTRVAGMTGTYHGATLGALSVTGASRARRGYEDVLAPVFRVRLPFCAHCPLGLSFAAGCEVRCFDELEALISGPAGDQIAALVVEPVVAHASGCVPMPRPYAQRLGELCRAHDVLVIADEITTGLGRTGSLFVSPDVGLDADIVCIGKGLGVGYAAMSAVLVADDVTAAMPESRNLMGHNYNGHPLAVAVARQVLSRLRAPGMNARLNELGQTLAAQLTELAAQVPWVGDVRVAGLLASVDLVADRTTRRPWEPARRVAERVSRAAFEEGLLVLAGSGNIDGVNGDHITLAPAFVADEADLSEMVVRLRRAIERVCGDAEGEFDA